ncbi:MAG: DUF4440 domain-containing protein [Bacteroidetes bacterium]|nr:DUF4440 domain-containing protein [Bacteroidota bacterium]
MKKFFLFLLFVAGCAKNSTPGLTADDQAIRQTLNRQVAAWNQGNLTIFMEGYWKSDSLLFIGKKISKGWDSTLLRYQHSYPDRKTMGELRFEILQLDFASATSCLVTGHYFLKREKDNPSGIFTLLFKKKKGGWVIVYDHTS